MKIVYLILCHKFPSQVASLINQLQYNNHCSFMIHIDKYSNIDVMKKEIMNNYLVFLFEHDNGQVKINEVWKYNSFDKRKCKCQVGRNEFFKGYKSTDK